MAKVVLLGLDCLSPELVFDRWLEELPAFRELTRRGVYGTLTSCIPPITVPAWSCMLSSKDPGQLGIYGFRNRTDHSYTGLSVATSRSVKHDRVWDILGRSGGRSIAIGVPGTFPPPHINGVIVGDFLTPSKDAEYTWPASLRQRIDEIAPNYRFDVTDFRTHNKQSILDQIFEMTADRFRVARELMRTEPWDFFMLHEIGPDRIHHGFWSSMDSAHPRYVQGGPYEGCILEYYRALDKEVGRLIDELPAGTAIIVASDHGAKMMKGGVCVNEWLMQRGYLALKAPLAGPTPLAKAGVDWSRTLAWGEGGYYARVFFNVEGREPEGALPAERYESFARELADELRGLPDHLGHPMDTRVYRPNELYRQVEGIPPDLTVLFDDLSWRSVGTLGGGSIYTFENDTGPDDANHAMDGLIMLNTSEGSAASSRISGATLYDVAPTILQLLELDVPEDMLGRSLVGGTPAG
ncbi:MAG TPA: alkaline phosphatase family protein [Chloroflexota bacterium]|nr:alkaline phosphatase family protein [Chloroflexota bacterium]